MLHRLLTWMGVLVGCACALIAGPRAWGQTEPPVTVSVQSDRQEVRPGDPFVIAVIFDHAPGWHVHTNDPKVPASWEDFTAIPTEVKVVPPHGVTVGPAQWPKPEFIKLDLMGVGKPESYGVFGDRAVVFVPAIVAADAGEKISLTVRAAFQACNDRMCLAPEDVEWLLEVRVLPASGPPGAMTQDGVFAGFDQSVLASSADWGKAAVPAPNANSAAPTSASNGAAQTFFGIQRPAGLLGLALLAVLGGFILNLTPCVLPVIPIKIMTISQYASTPGKSLYLGIWMALGVIAFWLGIGLPVVLFQSFGDPSRLFAIWWVTFGIGVLIAIMSIGLIGLFQFTLPQGLYMINPKAETAWGSFVFGVMTAVLGLPCFGFVAGALLVGSAALPKVAILTVFGCLGVGMALPYLVLSAKPSLVAKIPRTGPASELVKQVMGLLLLAAAMYFIGSGLIALVREKPYLGTHLHVWAMAALAVTASVWLILRTVQITRSVPRRATFGLIATLIGGLGVAYAWDSTARAKTNWEAQRTDLVGSRKLVTGTWIEFDEALFREARERKLVVVLDFTAEWCLTCKFLKATVLSKEPVKSALANPDTVLFSVDLTARSASGWELLRRLGRTGIPTLAVYTPGVEQPWIENAYTAEMVVDAIQKARSHEVAKR